MSIQRLPLDLTEKELIKNLERWPEQCEQDTMNEFQCWEKEQEEITALVHESERWSDLLTADHRDDIIAMEQESTW